MRIFVKSGLTFRGGVTATEQTASRPLVAYFGTSNALLESPFDGTVVAPKAKIVLSSFEHIGAFFGKKLEVQAGAKLRYAQFTGTWQPGT